MGVDVRRLYPGFPQAHASGSRRENIWLAHKGLWMVLGVMFAVCVLILLLCLLGHCCTRRRRNQYSPNEKVKKKISLNLSGVNLMFFCCCFLSGLFMILRKAPLRQSSSRIPSLLTSWSKMRLWLWNAKTPHLLRMEVNHNNYILFNWFKIFNAIVCSVWRRPA